VALSVFLAGCAPPVCPGGDTRDLLVSELLEFRDTYEVPGITAAIVYCDERAVSAAVGLADREHKTPMTPETRMLAASIGKTLVAATVLSLKQEDRLELDAPISRYLNDEPWFEQLPNGDQITVRQLLNHTSGLPDHVQDLAFQRAMAERFSSDTAPFSADQLIGFILDGPALDEPGASWSYSDTGYVLLGLIIEDVTGVLWSDEVRQSILEPLALKHTEASDRKELERLAAGYAAAENPFGLPAKSTDDSGVMTWNPAVEHAGGGFVSTSNDLATWGSELFCGRAISSAALDEMLDGVELSPGKPAQKYGAGVSIESTEEFGVKTGHAGWIPGYVSSLRHYPQLGATVAFQINTDVGIADSDQDPVGYLERQLARLAQRAATSE